MFGNRTEGRGGLCTGQSSLVRMPARRPLLHSLSFGDYSLELGEQYVQHLRLIEVEIFIKIEVSDRCSDGQKLFFGHRKRWWKHYVQKKLRKPP